MLIVDGFLINDDASVLKETALALSISNFTASG